MKQPRLVVQCTKELLGKSWVAVHNSDSWINLYDTDSVKTAMSYIGVLHCFTETTRAGWWFRLYDRSDNSVYSWIDGSYTWKDL